MSWKDPVGTSSIGEQAVFRNIITSSLGHPEINLLAIECGIVHRSAGGGKSTADTENRPGGCRIEVEPMRLESGQIARIARQRRIIIDECPDADGIAVYGSTRA